MSKLVEGIKNVASVVAGIALVVFFGLLLPLGGIYIMVKVARAAWGS